MAETRGVHLVGSVPLGTAENVFRTINDRLRGHLTRIPDGETGERTNWIAFQRQILGDHPKLQEVPQDPPLPFPVFGLKPGEGAPVEFGPLGYAEAALASWATFRALKAAGQVDDDVRFQVSLPTPLAVVAQYVEPGSQQAVEAGYKAQLLAEFDQVVAAIPRDQLAVQWDVAIEFAVLEGLRAVWFDDPRQGMIDRLTEVCDRVPAGVECGVHLCYGDAGHKHFKEPEDTGHLVDVSNALSAGVSRSLDWIHMPVPRARDDDAYYAPLAALVLKPETKLYLGLVHETGGIEGTRRRMAAAGKVLGDFGVATECGFGRRPADSIPGLLDIHVAAAAGERAGADSA